MRLLSFILAIFFFTLTIIPCGDEDNCGDRHTGTTIEYIHSGQDQNTQNENGFCSPLCTCHCCGGVTIVHDQHLYFAVNDPYIKNSLYSENSISEIFSPIWQPPKI